MFGIGLLGVIISYLSTGMEQGLRDSVADNITTAINVLSIGAWMVGVVVGVPWMIIEAVKRRRAR
jgi:hypothetical protein